MSPDLMVFGNMSAPEDFGHKNGWITGLYGELDVDFSEQQQKTVSYLVNELLHDPKAIEPEAPIFTTVHSLEVATYAVLLAAEQDQKITLDNQTLLISASGLLHDIGKSKLPDLHQYQNVYTHEEKLRHKDHTTLGAELAEQVELPDIVIKAVRNHHERFDGLGYKEGLKGDEIPMIARLIALADATQAALRPRPHNHNGSGFIEGELDDIHHKFGESELKFDPQLMPAFERLSAALSHEANLSYLHHSIGLIVDNLYKNGHGQTFNGIAAEPINIAREFSFKQ